VSETLTPIEAGLYLNLDFRTISRLAEKGLIPGFKVGRRWRFRKAALEKWFLEDSVQDENMTNLWTSISYKNKEKSKTRTRAGCA
jgi:excisionase family DNA binding protein